ncbi:MULTISPECIES: Yip1 family protein [Sediminimonas]|uniref:Yip1 family protein n=1 Tax=Sediminimonas TaxID=659427 RepID=UPI0003FA74CF|nr:MULTISPECIES: Yip1 family protein [Sediminimonas]MDR9484216.1 Yip1 family protein [Sediminimonas sp.]
MNRDDLVALVVETVRRPADAARRILAWRIASSLLWMGFALTVVLNTLLFHISSLIYPMPSGAIAVPALFSSPFLYAAVMGGGLLLMALVLTQVGKMLGGVGRFEDVLTLLVWLQALRLAAQVIVLVLMALLPAFAALVTMAIGLLSLWILMNFINAVHGFDSLGRSFMALVLAILGISVGLSMLLALFGGVSVGMT